MVVLLNRRRASRLVGGGRVEMGRRQGARREDNSRSLRDRSGRGSKRTRQSSDILSGLQVRKSRPWVAS
jgi:hypothetical protein